MVYVASRPKECRNPACPLRGKRYPAAAAQGVALPHSTYGLDGVAQIGWWRDHEHLSGNEIYHRLQGRIQSVAAMWTCFSSNIGSSWPVPNSLGRPSWPRPWLSTAG